MQHTPMNRFGNPDELKGAVVYLASSKASSFVTAHSSAWMADLVR